jgi:hypothetical protein
MDKTPSHNLRNWRAYAISVAAMVMITASVAAYLVLTPSGADALRLATTKQPERFTELYFNNTGALPTQVTAGKLYTFSFDVTNREYTTTEYLAQTSIVTGTSTTPLRNYTFELREGASQNESVTFKAPEAGTQFELMVTLPNQNETIYFRSAS